MTTVDIRTLSREELMDMIKKVSATSKERKEKITELTGHVEALSQEIAFKDEKIISVMKLECAQQKANAEAKDTEIAALNAKMAQWKEKVKVMMSTTDAEIARLTAELNAKVSELQTFRERTAQWKEKVKTVTLQDQARITQLESQVKELLSEVSTKVPEDNDAVFQQQRSEVAVLTQQLETKDRELSALRKEIEKRGSNTSVVAEEATASIKELQTQIATLSGDLSRAQAENAALVLVKSQLDAEGSSSTTQRLQEAELRILKLQKEIEGNQAIFQQHLVQVAQSLEKDLATSKASALTLAQQLQAKEVELCEANATVVRVQAHYSAMENDLKSHLSAIKANGESKIVTLAQQLQAKEVALSAIERTKAELESRVLSMDIKLKETVDQHEAIEAERMKERENELHLVTLQLRESRAAVGLFTQAKADLQKALEVKQEELAVLSVRLSQSDAEASLCSGQLSESQRELSMLKVELHTKVSELQVLQERTAQWKEKVKTVTLQDQARIELLEKEHRFLHMKLVTTEEDSHRFRIFSEQFQEVTIWLTALRNLFYREAEQ